jgi:osmoprotectant transport system permease protein
VSEQLALLPTYLSAHLRLTLAALLLGLLASVPAGVLVTRVRWLEAPVLGLAGVIQTVPALALLAVMVPLLSGMGLQGIGYLPALLGLILYSLLPILRNTVTGLAGLDPAVLEAARGLGLTPRQQLFWVELPLALPVIAAGIRTATVWTVGMATLSTPVGAPSLGNYIFSGLQTRNTDAVLVGCLAAAALALTLDALLRQVVLGLTARGRVRAGLGAAGILALGAWSLLAGPARRTGAEAPVRVGAKTFTEQYVLAEILARYLGAQTAHPVTVTSSLGSTVAFDALRRDEIDVYVDYTGTLWSTVMGRSGSGGGRQAVLEEVRSWLRQRHGITLAAALGFENSYAFALKRARAAQLGVTRLGELTPHAPQLLAGSDYEFFGRPEWRAVQAAYGLRFREQRSMDPSLLYAALARDQVDVITAYSSDGRIAAFDLVTLEDERGAIPPYDAVVLAGPRLARERPEVVAALARLEGRIDVARMRELNRQVDADRKSPAAVAEAFLAGGP